MNTTSRLRINPEILKWARVESGYSIDYIARKIDIEQQTYILWEDQDSEIPFSKLKSLAKLLKRQIAFFFLSDIPQSTKKPKDFRNLMDDSLSPETHLVFRRAQRYLDVLKELNDNNFYSEKYEWLNEFKNQFGNQSLLKGNVSSWVREKLQYTVNNQISDTNIEKSYKNWRQSFENNLGIYTFQFSMPTEEVQGFCYADSFPYCIVVNNNYSTASKIFTLFHELGHILKKQSAMCLPDLAFEDKEEELECNSFAGRTLLPEDIMQPLFDANDIFSYSRKLKVSSEVYLRRLRSLNLINKKDFFALLDDIHQAVKPKKKGFAISSPLQKSLNSRGQKFFYTVVDAARLNRITYSHASDVLGIKINHILTT
ncbi:MAG TPA: ImmA/IrrE family metallo-endopeptidase [Smithella sp.]|nr:ImmA/IrrE family metallo-endopeptidase [Smithella sp.]